jgi:integrase
VGAPAQFQPDVDESLRRSICEMTSRHVGSSMLDCGGGGNTVRNPNAAGQAVRATLKELGLPDVGIHVLRHSAAAALIRTGASPTAVQRILGHRSAAFTLTVYGHIFDADLDLVAENLDEAMVSGARQPHF